jgi:hypothetical protein
MYKNIKGTRQAMFLDMYLGRDTYLEDLAHQIVLNTLVYHIDERFI